jgi:hypothetical protein
MSNSFKKLLLVLVTLLLGVMSGGVRAQATFTYLPDLTGYYYVGDSADIYGGNATYKSSGAFSSNLNPVTYQFSGIFSPPVPTPNSNNTFGDPTKINYNGGFYSPFTSTSWGMDLGTYSFGPWNQSYNPSTGRFSFTYSPGASSNGGSVSVYNVFYNYGLGGAEFSDRGYVFIESARLGFGATQADLTNNPMQILATYSGTPPPAPVPNSGFGDGGGVGVPEIDGALAPKVGFLLACLFLIFGRKRENTESMLTV